MKALLDAGPIIALFNRRDHRHDAVHIFFAEFDGQFVTTSPVVTECMWNLKNVPVQTQNELLANLVQGIYQVEPLIPTHFQRIAELNTKYADRPADFADLSLVAISERLNIPKILTFDSDFEIYRRFKSARFERIGFGSKS